MDHNKVSSQILKLVKRYSSVANLAIKLIHGFPRENPCSLMKNGIKLVLSIENYP